MANLYELVNDFKYFEKIYNDAESQDEMIEAEQYLIETEVNLSDKVENIAKLIKNFEAERDVFKKEANRLAAKAKSFDNKVTNLKRYLQDNLAAAGVDKVKGNLFTVSLRNNPLSLSVNDISNVPDEFIRTPEPTVNKRELLNHIKETGEVFEGVEVRQTSSIRIR